MIRRVAALGVVLGAAVVAVPVATAAPAAAVCRPFTQAGHTYTSETLGTSWTCAAAKGWIVKLSGDRIAHSAKNVPLTNGPRGLHCFATPNSIGGRATAGACFKGTIAFPGTGFAWTGS